MRSEVCLQDFVTWGFFNAFTSTAEHLGTESVLRTQIIWIAVIFYKCKFCFELAPGTTDDLLLWIYMYCFSFSSSQDCNNTRTLNTQTNERTHEHTNTRDGRLFNRTSIQDVRMRAQDVRTQTIGSSSRSSSVV